MALASHLLDLNSANCRYFGALSYTVAIQNLDLPSEEQLNQIILSLGIHIRRLTETSPASNLPVLRKLISNLAQVFIHYHNKSRNPLSTFIEAIANTTFDDHQSFATCISSFSPLHLNLLLLFFSIIIEDVTRLNDFKLSVHNAIRSHIFPFLITCVDYMKHLHSQNRLPHDVDLEALKTVSSWFTYIPNIGGDLRFLADDIVSIIEYLMIHLQGDCVVKDEERLRLCKECLAIFSEILEGNAALLSMETKLTLYSYLFDEGSWGSQFLHKIALTDAREEFDEEVNAYVFLAIVIAQLNLIRLSKSILEPQTRNVLSILYQLTAIPGVPFIDESYSEQILIFWEEFANVYVDLEDLVDILLESNNDPGFAEAFENEKRRIFDEVAKIYWSKSQIPGFSAYQSIKTDFFSYRSNVADFFMVLYNLLKAPFYQSLAGFVVEKSVSNDLDEKSIAELEASLFFLYKINDDSSYYELQTRELVPFSNSIFNSGVLQAFRSLPSKFDLYVAYTSTFLHYLNSNEFFFASDEGSEHLNNALDYLFPIIMAGQKPLSYLASKTVTNLCERCSEKLLKILPSLEPVVLEMLKNPDIDSLVRLRIFNAFSVIARSLSDMEEHARLINGLITTIGDAARSMISMVDSELKEEQEEYLVSLISCIISIAKGSGLPDEIVDNMSDEEQDRYKKFWESDPLQTKQVAFLVVKQLCMEFPPLHQKTIVVEKSMQVFKAGLGEKLNGPLTFDRDTVCQFAIDMNEALTNPNAVPHVFALIEAVINFEFRDLHPEMVKALIDQLVTRKLEFLKTDPDMLKSAIDLSTKIIECKPSLIIYTDDFVNTILSIALEGISANEVFIVKSILKFWTSFILLKKGGKEDQERLSDLILRGQIGQILTVQLLKAFFKAPRSSLEVYYMVFRAIIGKFPVQSKDWLTDALSDPETIAYSKVPSNDLRMFVHRLVVTRGRRAANDVLKSFWLLVNGFVEYNSQSF